MAGKGKGTKKERIIIASIVGLIVTVLIEVFIGGLPVVIFDFMATYDGTSIKMSGFSEFVVFTILAYFLLGEEMTKQILDSFARISK